MRKKLLELWDAYNLTLPKGNKMNDDHTDYIEYPHIPDWNDWDESAHTS